MAADRTAPERAARTAFVISQLYYYVGAVAGVGLVIGGAIGALQGARTMILPEEYEGVRDGLRRLLSGLAFGLPGAVTLQWHIRQARGREGRTVPPAFWGRILYYHLVALLALGFVIGGTVGLLNSAVDAAIPQCYEAVPEPVPAEGVEAPPKGSVTYGSVRECHPVGADALRQVLNSLIVLIVAAPVFLWHLREGRRATVPLPDATAPPPAPTDPPPAPLDRPA